MGYALTMQRTHQHAVIISIGDELVLGQSTDTNSAWLSEHLLSRGVRPVRHVTVDDEAGAIASEIKRGAADATLVIVTGGLGPTADDLTRAAMARAMGAELVEDAGALAVLKSLFSTRGIEMAAQNRVQALRPKGAVCLDNPNGTAPGLHGVVGAGRGGGAGGADVFCLPGPPREMQPMFGRFVEPMLRPGRVVETQLVRTFGLGESQVAERLGALMDRGRNPLVGVTAQSGVVTVRLRWEQTISQSTSEEPALAPIATDQGSALLDEVERQVREALGVAVVTRARGEGGRDARSTGKDVDGKMALAAVVVDLLQERDEHLAVVESCTGGLLGSMLTSVAGASGVFCGGWITYTNAMKAEAAVGIGVPEGLFPEVQAGAPGAVSGQVAQAMALGGLHRGVWEIGGDSGMDHALAITGIAGPDGGSEAKPVGTVWICRASRDGSIDCRRFVFPGEGIEGRASVREWAAVTALGMLRLKLAGGEMPLAFEREQRTEINR